MLKRFASTLSATRVAILYQATPPPIIDGQRKKMKEGGYSDSGADIGYVLSQRGIDIVTPVYSPNEDVPMDWVFPDTSQGIAAALSKGANVLYANTVVFSGHPVEDVKPPTKIVGQLPASVQKIDDKFYTNKLLRDEGLPIAKSYLLGSGNPVASFQLGKDKIKDYDLTFPVIIKPLRGRGSQGVTLVKSDQDLIDKAQQLIQSGTFGSLLMLEEYLGGDEITVTVMPPKSPRPDGSLADSHWALRPVRRTDQVDGVMPYNGVVPVSENSKAIDSKELATPVMQEAIEACVKATEIIDGRSPVRIDCRLDLSTGKYKIFDFNMKPNMTGPGRPGRDNQDSLCAIAARADGWSYGDLLTAIILSAWTN